MTKLYFSLFLFAALVAYLATPAARALGRRSRAYGDRRDRSRSRRVPRLGGLAIFCAFLAALAAAWFASPAGRGAFRDQEWIFVRLILASAIVLALGAFDDLAGSTPARKLAIETVAASLLWMGGVRLTAFPVFGWRIDSLPISFVVTTLWIVSVTNAFNLTDGLDGLAAGVALLVALTLFAVAVSQNNVFLCLLTVIVGGALAGFLRFNTSPASVYLGDTGSLFLGFFLGSLAVLASQSGAGSLSAAVPFAAFGHPLLEVLITVLRRQLAGWPLCAPDRNHFHHRLLSKKLSPRLSAVVLYGLAAVFAFGSLAIASAKLSGAVLAGLLGGVAVFFLAGLMRYEEFSNLFREVPRPWSLVLGRLQGGSPSSYTGASRQPEVCGGLEVLREASPARSELS